MSATAETVSPAKAVTIGSLKAAQQLEVQNLPPVTMGFGSLQSFELMQRAAKLLTASTLVPKEYQGNLPNCVIALNMAQRMGADPLMVMQNLYVVHGRPSWSAQFLIACFNQCGRFSAMRYKWTGTEGNDNWSCQAHAKELGSGEVIVGPVISIALAKKEGWYAKNGSKWQSIPQLMLMYRAAAWLVRTHAPELSMGLQTDHETHDVYDATRGFDGEYGVTVQELRSPQGQVTQSSPGPELITWVNTLNGSPALPEHEAAWAACCAAYGGTPPNECDAAYQNRKEALAENAGKQLDM